MPRPKVTSSVVALTPRAEPPCDCADEALMFRCVRAAFSQRRKTLSNALAHGLAGFTREEVLAALLRRRDRPLRARRDAWLRGIRRAGGTPGRPESNLTGKRADLRRKT